MLTGLRTLVLSANYMPISVFPLETIPAEDAVCRILNGTCHVVMEYDRKILTPSLDMKWPSVIARNDSDPVRATESVKLRRDTVFYRDHGICAYCERPLSIKETTFDHVWPKSKGGRHTWNNVVAACGNCNVRKGNRLPLGEWKPKIDPWVPNHYQMLDLRKKFPIVVEHKSWASVLDHDWTGGVLVRDLTGSLLETA